MTVIKEKRAYEAPDPEDGFRIYVDRLWPRGMSHATFHYDLWDKEIAPSADLRHWFHEDPQNRWPQFAQKYEAELLANPALTNLRGIIREHSVVTLLYSSKEENHNNATVLKDVLLKE